MSDFLINELIKFQKPLKSVKAIQVATSGTNLVSITGKVLVKAVLTLEGVGALSADRDISLILLKGGVTFYDKNVHIEDAADGTYAPAHLEIDFGPQGLEAADWQIDFASAGYTGSTWAGILVYKD